MANTLSDADLVASIKRRDPEAMGDLYDRYGKLAYTVILHIVQDEDIAEDLLAETFVKIWNQTGHWEDNSDQDLALWLLLLARAHAIEYLRSVNEPLPRLPRLTPLTQPAVLQAFPRPQDREQLELARHVFAALDEQERRVLEMACFDGHAPSEIAERTGLPLSAVKAITGGVIRKLAEF